MQTATKSTPDLRLRLISNLCIMWLKMAEMMVKPNDMTQNSYSPLGVANDVSRGVHHSPVSTSSQTGDLAYKRTGSIPAGPRGHLSWVWGRYVPCHHIQLVVVNAELMAVIPLV